MTRDPRRNAWLDPRSSGLDPDPLTVEPEPVRRRGCGLLVLALLLAFSASRSATTVIPAAQPGPVASGNPSSQTSVPSTGDRLRGTAGAHPSVVPPAYSQDLRVATNPPLSAVTRGWATWYRDPSRDRDAFYGAVPSWRHGDEPYTVLVTAFVGGRASGSVHVTIVDFCACGDRHGVPTVVDLSPAAFRTLAPLGRGVIRVEVERVDGVPLPATDTEAVQ